jgi:hypothetical protein
MEESNKCVKEKDTRYQVGGVLEVRRGQRVKTESRVRSKKQEEAVN